MENDRFLLPGEAAAMLGVDPKTAFLDHSGRRVGHSGGRVHIGQRGSAGQQLAAQRIEPVFRHREARAGHLLEVALQQGRHAADPHAGVPLLTLERLTFRFANAGFVLLSATLIAGLFFSEKLYGQGHSGIRWDHKTIFSILSWLVFAFLLLGRLRFGWRGRKAVRVLYTGSLLLLLAYAGSRFVLEVVLKR